MNGNATAETRFHSLDAVRAWALLAGIVLHATMAHLPGFAGLNWPISDQSTSAPLGFTFFVIHIFRMSLFFIIAGFFGRLLHRRLGTGGLIRNRLRRIGLPLVASMLLVAPLVIVAIVMAVKLSGRPPAPPVAGAQPPVFGPPVPWMHLWFLYLLLLMFLLVLPLRALVARCDTGRALRDAVGRAFAWLVASRLAPLVLATPLVFALLAARWWLVWQGIPVPAAGFVPNLPALVAYGSAFAFGWLMHREQRVLHSLAADWLAYLGAAIGASLAAILLAGDRLHFSLAPLDEGRRIAYACAYAIACWCWCFACLGAAVRFLDRPSARLRYLADASYWMYLAHLPVIWLLQAWMLKWPLHWSVKFPLVLAASLALLVASYHWLVRNTFVGVFLNGRRYPRSQEAAVISTPSTSPG
jgi:peptidoglycan/LPS O-acetylase OafA/YrhL